MSADAELEKLPLLAAEEVLRTLYGDDFKGCTVNPETIANIIREAINPTLAKDRGLRDMYEKVIEAIHRLSTPPPSDQITDPSTLRSLLGERLDAIHSITVQTRDATDKLKG